MNDYIDAFTTNERIVGALYALIDLDADGISNYPEITVNYEPDDENEIESVEYDGSGVVPWHAVQDEFTKILDAFPSEVTVGWGRPLEILLQGGGPTHWIEATLDSDGDVVKAVLYATQEGPDHVDRQWNLSQYSALYRLTESLAETNQDPHKD